MADSKEKLFSDFSPVSTEQWMEKVTADLKGADFEKKLVCLPNELLLEIRRPERGGFREEARLEDKRRI